MTLDLPPPPPPPAPPGPEQQALLTFNALGHDLRWKIIILLMAWGEQSVKVLTHRLEVDQPKTSHHLAILVGAELIKKRRDGQRICYSLSDVWTTKENAVELLIGGKVGISINNQDWDSTDS